MPNCPVSTRLSLRGPESFEGGSVVLEATLSLILLVMLFLSLYDVGTLIHNYILLTQAASESARYAARVPMLESGTHSSNEDLAAYPNHVLIHNRTFQAITLQLHIKGLSNINVSSTYAPALNPPAGETPDTARVMITAQYTGLLPMFNATLSVAHETAYLF